MDKISVLYSKLLLVCILILPIGVFAQPILTASIAKNTFAIGEQFQLTYSLNTSGNRFQGPDLKDFNVLGGPNQGSQIQIVNGNYSQSLNFTYYLQAKSEGTFKIGFASIDADGKRIQSNGLIVTVVKGNPNQQGQQSGNSQGQENAGISEKNIFLKAEVSKTNVYQGEALSVTFKLYTNVNIINYSVTKMPSIPGFWNQEIKLPEQLQLHNETVNGINYKVGELKKMVLFPQQNGNLTIDPMELECIARIQVKGRSRNDPFGMLQDPFFNDPFFGFGSARDVKYSFKSNKVNVNVKSLPPNAPAGFNGSVGELTFDAYLDKKETKANEPVALKIKISGNGNLKLIDAPVIDIPSDIESYDPKVSDNLHVSESGVTGSKSVEYLIIPRHEGIYDLGPITFSYFDLNKKQYVSRTAGPFTLKVGKGIGGNNSAVSGNISKSDFQLLGKDIRYIKLQEPEFINTTGNFYGSISYYSLVFAPLLLFFGLLTYRNKMEALNSDQILLKSRKATSVAQKRLKNARKLLETNQQHALQEEISKALWGYMGDKLAIPFADLSKEKIESSLNAKQVNQEYIKSFLSTLDQCEMSRFAGTTTLNDASLFDLAVKTISDIENSLKS